MELTRRDATAALAAIGATGAVALGSRHVRRNRADDPAANRSKPDGSGPTDEDVADVLTAVATVVYPDEVSGIETFVDGFLDGRLEDEAHAEGLKRTIEELSELARSWHGAEVTDLSVDERQQLLREIGADSADEDPSGTTAERVRYYVVNELLLALYASPTGGELVGIENPQGYPGGAESYARGP